MSNNNIETFGVNVWKKIDADFYPIPHNFNFKPQKIDANFFEFCFGPIPLVSLTLPLFL